MHIETRAMAASVALLAAAAWGCAAKPATIEVSPPDATVSSLDETPKLTARVLDAAGNPIEGAQVAWSTPDEGVLTVDPATGALQIKGSGRAEIDADLPGVRGICTVTVALYTTLRTDAQSVSLGVGQVQKVAAAILDEKGQEIQGAIEWTSANPAIASVVGSRGEIRGVAPGTTTVVATAKSLQAEVQVEVIKPGPAELGVSKALLVLKVGKTGRIEGKPLDENAQPAEGYSVRYESYDPAVATVDEDGTVTGAAKGETRIAVSAGDKTVDVKVRVE